MKCFLVISNLLEEIFSLSILSFSSIALHWSLRKAYSAFKWVYLSFSPLPLASLRFSAICKDSSDNHFKITVDNDCSHEIKRCLLLGRKVMTNLDSILKSKNITLLTKVHIVKAMVFPVVMYGCESWTTKKAECQRTDALELWCWKRFLSPLDCKDIKPINPKGNQPWLFNGRSAAEAEAPVLWPPDAKNWLIGKDPDCRGRLKARGEGDNRG